MSDINLTGTAETAMRDPYELMQIFESAEDLPTLPEIAVRLQEVVDDPHSDARDVAKIIQDDPAIATKVLKVVNSVFYAPRGCAMITELQPAVARMGFVAVVNIVLSTSVFQAFARVQQPVFDRREFWRHSVCVGIAAAVLHDYLKEKEERPISRDSVHLAGIVHDMGKILFERYANPEFHTAIHNAREYKLPGFKEESRFLGLGHDEAGAWLAEKWQIDPAIQAVVHWHHDPLGCEEEEYSKLVKLVHMADYICHSQNLGDSGNPYPMYDERVRKELQLTDEKIMELMEMVEIEAANSEILLSLAG